jgi:glutathione S-transferase
MLTLYHASHSTCSQKVRIVLHEKGLKFDDIKLDLAKKDQLKPEYIALNPNAVVPTLVDDGVPIIESSVICEYLDEKFPQNSMVPEDIVERAHARLDALH